MTQVRAVELQPGMVVRSLLGERCTVAQVDNHGFLVTIQYTDGTRESARPDALLDLLPDGLTRAAKERAVAGMARRLSAASENYAWAAADPDHFKGGSAAHFNRRERSLTAALVRLAMAATVD